MSENRAIEYETTRRIAAISPSLTSALEAIEHKWFPELPPPYVAMDSLASEFIRLAANDPIIRLVLAEVEGCIVAGGSAADLVATGFLESLLNSASAGEFDFAAIVHLLGPESLRYCKAWDEFTGCTTTVDAMFQILSDLNAVLTE